MSHSATDIVTPTAGGRNFHLEVTALRELITEAEKNSIPRLPGNARFLSDGRVLCRPRQLGDSRYPYGQKGLHFWVHASGRIYANRGQYCIFLPHLDGHEPRVAFFVGRRVSEGHFQPASILPTPLSMHTESRVRERFSVFGHDAAYFGVYVDQLFCVLRVFVDQTRRGRLDICFSTLIVNESCEHLELYTSAFINPFCRHQFAETSEDRWFKQISVADTAIAPQALRPFEITVNEDIDRFHSATNYGCLRRATDVSLISDDCCTSRVVYLGEERIALGEARCLQQGAFAQEQATTVFTDNAIAGDLARFALHPRQTAQFHHVLTLLPPDEKPTELIAEPLSPTNVDAMISRVRHQQAEESHHLSVQMHDSRLHDVSNHTFNSFLPFLIKQVDVCAQTRGYMQPSPNSLIGIRDVFQALEGQMYDQPELARAKILEGMEFVLTDGRCPRQYSLPAKGKSGQADLREFIDQGVWVVSAIHAYVMLTGDVNLLHETVGYHRIVSEEHHRIEPADEFDTVLEHLFRIMTYLDRQRDPATRLLRILYGDWNDAVDGLGTALEPGSDYGTGVSVMATLQLYQNCEEMITLLKMLPDSPRKYATRQSDYAEMQAELREGLLQHAVVEQDDERRIVHGWGDRRRYFVGSFADSDGLPRDSLTSNAFWVLSGLLRDTPELRPHILAALQRLDARYGLKTFEPGFAQEAPGVGRVRRLPLGTAENGATYIHASLFGAWALFEMGEAQAAWDQLHKLLPFSAHHTQLSHSPFVMPNSYVDNPELGLIGQSMNDWQTGSSNVLLKILIRCVYGLCPGPDQLLIAPAACSPFDRFEFEAIVRRRPITIRYERCDTSVRQILLNGEPLACTIDDQRSITLAAIPYTRLSDDHNDIQVKDPQ